MSTLVTLNSTDLITNSRADINGNFAALNADKMETSVLDTDTTLAANSDSKVATQKAVKAYVDAGGNVNASTTAKGIVEEATQAEVDAGTEVGSTGARLYVNPSTPFYFGGFGDGSDGDVTLDGATNYAAFSSRSGSIYTLTRHLRADDLTINSGVTVRTDGFYIFVKGTISGTGTLEWGTPNNGSSGSYSASTADSPGGAGGTQTGTGPLKNKAGSNGGNGGGTSSTGGENSGDNGTASTECIGSSGVAGGAGGNGNGVASSGAAGTGGTATAPYTPFPVIKALVTMWFDKKSDNTLAQLVTQGGAGGGAGGRDSSASFCSGPGGGGGASGGDIFLVARTWAGSFTIKSIGGTGGAGLAGQGTGTGGGGGGGGGNGGNSVVIYLKKTWTGTYNLAGGAGGAGGASGGGGSDTAGSSGTTGNAGTQYEVPVTSLV